MNNNEGRKSSSNKHAHSSVFDGFLSPRPISRFQAGYTSTALLSPISFSAMNVAGDTDDFNVLNDLSNGAKLKVGGHLIAQNDE